MGGFYKTWGAPKPKPIFGNDLTGEPLRFLTVINTIDIVDPRNFDEGSVVYERSTGSMYCIHNATWILLGN